jgi:uncharacterized repeat protein (TIGR03803 family)
MSLQRSSLAHRGLLVILSAIIFSATAFAADPRERVLYSFPAGEGSYQNLVADREGNLYGTTFRGGSGSPGCGNVFELSRLAPPNFQWTETQLYAFNCNGSDGAGPIAALIFDNSANLYGTTVGGGTYNEGVAFKLSRPATEGSQWTESVLYNFQGGDSYGLYPSGLVFDNSGNLYGTTESGGIYESGTIFELSPPATEGDQWTESVLYTFNSTVQDGTQGQGSYPVSTPIINEDGSIFGGTTQGGPIGNPYDNSGVIYRLDPPARKGGAWTYSVIYAFGSRADDGAIPYSSLTLRCGRLFGTTNQGGQYGDGTVFELLPPVQEANMWTENILYSFGSNGSGAAYPQSNVIIDRAGNLYGTTVGGRGAVYKLAPPGWQDTDWTESTLYDFPNPTTDGEVPGGGLIFDHHERKLFGVTTSGGADAAGTVFELVDERWR